MGELHDSIRPLSLVLDLVASHQGRDITLRPSVNGEKDSLPVIGLFPSYSLPQEIWP